jgi:hypothetical protein
MRQNLPRRHAAEKAFSSAGAFDNSAADQLSNVEVKDAPRRSGVEAAERRRRWQKDLRARTFPEIFLPSNFLARSFWL